MSSLQLSVLATSHPSSLTQVRRSFHGLLVCGVPFTVRSAIIPIVRSDNFAFPLRSSTSYRPVWSCQVMVQLSCSHGRRGMRLFWESARYQPQDLLITPVPWPVGMGIGNSSHWRCNGIPLFRSRFPPRQKWMCCGFATPTTPLASCGVVPRWSHFFSSIGS